MTADVDLSNENAENVENTPDAAAGVPAPSVDTSGKPSNLWRATAAVRRAVKGTSRRVRSVLVVAVIVALAVTDGLLWWAGSSDRAAASASEEALAVAKEEAVVLLSYDHTTIGRDLESIRQKLTGPFKDEFSQVITGIIAPVITQQQATTTAKVAAASMISAEADSVRVLLFMDESAKSESRPTPVESSSRVRMTMQRVDGNWLVSSLTTF